jgi:hypothetical protein
MKEYAQGKLFFHPCPLSFQDEPSFDPCYSIGKQHIKNLLDQGSILQNF